MLGNMPAVFHMTHWKAGSQWVKKMLSECFPERIIDVPIGVVKFKDFAESTKQNGMIYPALYITKEQFDSMVLPANWRGFVVIRDLRDTLISAYFSFKISHPLLTQYNVDMRNRLNEMDMEKGLIYLMDTWLPACARIQESWVEGDFELVHYEELLTRDLGIWERILIAQWQLPISKEMLEKVVFANRFEVSTGGRKPGEEKIESHLRKGIRGDWKNYMSDSLKEVFKGCFGKLLIKTGYEKSLYW